MSKPDRMPRAGRAARYTSGPLPSGGGRWHADGFDPVPREPTALHAQRLQAVHEAIRAAGGGRVADVGCGDGALVRRLLPDPAVDRIFALDRCLAALTRLERSVEPAVRSSGRLTLLQGSFTLAHPALAGVDVVAMVETIEHVAPEMLSAVERHVFGGLKPGAVIVTTPNQEYNELFGMSAGQMREPGHCFEWPRSRFRAWAAGVALRNGYLLQISGIGLADPHRGCPTQMAVFRRCEPSSAAR